ncbi:MAG: helix-turn-helix transcriptional regulator [Leptolyngbyaceae cyanobacterium SM1_3_5]|nr:helix-turn-helix transcriptional regulator [Leptolyngbyaceae cyanobacterium SM1_3_5]
MGTAGKALKQILETYGISQNRLAVEMGISRGTVHNWVQEKKDPVAESVLAIAEGLEKINEAAAKEFLTLYLGRFAEGDAEE